MFGIGLPEMVLILAVALIVVGPDKLPGLAKNLARQVLELKRAANSLKDSLNEEDRQAANLAEEFPQNIELPAQSSRVLPGDQWVHEQGMKTTERHHHETSSEGDEFETIVAE